MPIIINVASHTPKTVYKELNQYRDKGAIKINHKLRRGIPLYTTIIVYSSNKEEVKEIEDITSQYLFQSVEEHYDTIS